ncbi:LysR family transcriptional regulator [Roseateles saccharophilus]|uniref:DNA-binding transcriptional LysR family regulator n=1 Tax=Roseateles saccharophilus TaxID=304 RepID=A0A4R3UIK5_ROSSA|nr:LysR family transcriptional regulator [Roseateles saccharophilus]MDG0834712.1 LysR family transcriptional regulator [Roseateles saccharophilus]TCU88972.1 DNA-binding transcriptional LysR family regulator [Roseateles saccharophilus]
MAINELRSISTFIKAAELGSLRQAALALGISPQAASKALAQLETHLDARLFHRTTRVMSLTDAGQRLLDDVQPAVLGMQRALEKARSAKDEFAGPLRIVGPRTAFQHVLWRLVDEFCERHPGIQPDVLLDDRIGNWVEDRVDVGFRIGPSPHEGVIARRLFPLQLVICAAPSYLQRHGRPDSLAALASHRCSAYRSPGTGQVVPWRVKLGGQPADQPVVPAICCNDEVFELQAVLAGKVLGQLAGVTAAPFIRAGQLVPLLVDHMSDYASYFVYFGSRTSQPDRARAFIDLAVQRLSDNAEYVLSSKELAGGQGRPAAAAQRRAGRR